MSKQEVIICQHFEEDLRTALARQTYDKLFILTDEHTQALCWPLLQDQECLKGATHLCIGPGDIHKNLETLAYVWHRLSNEGATRRSLLLNLGGGMVTDLGGFAAATFKRGIPYINVPTTLLSMVDAAVGGKTGINFNELKNEIGAFHPAATVLIDCQFLRTLDHENLLSGYAEMLKHGLISDTEHWSELVNFDMQHIDYDQLQRLVGKSVQVKERIVEQDPFEHGIRKALNLGHTVGHAFESFALQQHPVLHGYAVAWGMVCELYLSALRTGFPKDKLHQTLHFIQENYGRLSFTCEDYETLFNFMKHDKKNFSAGCVNFTLLGGIGDIRINQTATQEEIYELLDFYRETL
ncbi:MAG: 3-dehydroquinate synthase [Bacteroidales bacterium]|nr:3-dehydroquinate synthase [Bacteroidales bacterium]